MDKEQFKLQVLHHRYLRDTIVCICRIVLYSIVYVSIVYCMVFLSTQSLKSGTLQTLSSIEGYQTILIILSVLYLVLIAIEVVNRIIQHGLLKDLESLYFGEDLTLTHAKVDAIFARKKGKKLSGDSHHDSIEFEE